ncbi:MAG: Gfo/Idh/MocA family oxidoreductase [Armatimonadetes bacterium]|nr:Gfo/Idh/MocA family oxidoreductase [Armatimonadota bacterium]
MKTIRMGYIGCGGNARGHMGRVHGLEGAEVAAVCDTVRELADGAAAAFKARAYTDMHKMLDTEELDAVTISIPVYAHGEPERAVAERGLPLLVEKPVARHLETAREIEAMLKVAGVISAVGYQLRYSSTVTAAKEFLLDKQIGLCVGSYWCGTGRLPASRWTVQFEKSGGQLLEQATHTVDMMRYLVGEIEEVHAYGARTILSHTDCDDAMVVSWKYRSGALGSLTTSWAMDNSDWRFANQVHLTGDGWHLHWSAPKLSIKQGGEELREVTDTGPSIDQVFCEAVRTKNQKLILSSYSDGVKSMAISIAAIESARRGEAVRIADLG